MTTNAHHDIKAFTNPGTPHSPNWPHDKQFNPEQRMDGCGAARAHQIATLCVRGQEDKQHFIYCTKQVKNKTGLAQGTEHRCKCIQFWDILQSRG